MQNLQIATDDLPRVSRFLYESNAIEGEYSAEALWDALNAWQFAVETSSRIDVAVILGIHKLLMLNLNPYIAGNVRSCFVTVGGIKCPPPKEVPDLLAHWLEDHGAAKNAASIKAAHIAFEKIHPFEDGNGQTGRILMNIQRVRAGLPITVIHEGAEQKAYYLWFK